MIHRRNRIPTILMAAVLALMAARMPAQLPPPSDHAELQREIAIMARVLEESLDRSSLGEWHWVKGGSSAFEPKIKTEYLPAIGAVFTIPVNFPIVDVAGGEAKSGPVDESDLWQKHTSGRDVDGDGNLDVIIRKWEDLGTKWGELGDTIGNSWGNALDQVGEAFEQALEPLTHWDRPEASRADQARERAKEKRVARGPSPLRPFRYDEAKVKDLRRVLLETAARYGRRLEHMSGDEKIMLLIEAPASLRGARLWSPGAEPMSGWEAPRPPEPPESPAPEMRDPVSDMKARQLFDPRARARKDAEMAQAQTQRALMAAQKALIQAEVQRRVVGPQVFIAQSGPGGRNHYLLTINKSDVAAETTAEALSAVVREFRY